MRVYNVFSVSESNYYKIEMDDICFIIGAVEDGYYRIKADVLGTERDYCFEKTIKLSRKDFVAARKTSILQMLDKLMGTNAKEVYIEKMFFLKLITILVMITIENFKNLFLIMPSY